MKFLMGLFFGLLVACSTITAQGILQFKDREFLVHPNKPAMSFPYDLETCTPRTGIGRILGSKCRIDHIEEDYDMNDKLVREKFIAADCTMTCAGRFQ